MQLTLKLGSCATHMTHFNWRIVNFNSISQIFLSDYTDTQPQASRLSLIFSIFVLVFSASSDRRALVRRNLRRPRAAAVSLTGPTGQPLSLSLLKPASQPEVLTGKSLWGRMDGGHTSVFLRTSNRQENPATHCTWPTSLFLFIRFWFWIFFFFFLCWILGFQKGVFGWFFLVLERLVWFLFFFGLRKVAFLWF